MNAYESVGWVGFSSLRRDASWPDIQFCHTWISIQTDPQPSFKHTSHWCCTQNILWTCHKHDNECLWIRWFGSTQLLFYQVGCLNREVSWPDIQFCHKWISIQADPQPSFKHTYHWYFTQNILLTCHEHDNEWLWINWLGWIQHSEEGCILTRHTILPHMDKHPDWPSTFLQTHIPLMLHTKYPLDMP